MATWEDIKLRKDHDELVSFYNRQMQSQQRLMHIAQAKLLGKMIPWSPRTVINVSGGKGLPTHSTGAGVSYTNAGVHMNASTVMVAGVVVTGNVPTPTPPEPPPEPSEPDYTLYDLTVIEESAVMQTGVTTETGDHTAVDLLVKVKFAVPEGGGQCFYEFRKSGELQTPYMMVTVKIERNGDLMRLEQIGVMGRYQDVLDIWAMPADTYFELYTDEEDPAEGWRSIPSHVFELEVLMYGEHYPKYKIYGGGDLLYDVDFASDHWAPIALPGWCAMLSFCERSEWDGSVAQPEVWGGWPCYYVVGNGMTEGASAGATIGLRKI